jgi:lysozyme
MIQTVKNNPKKSGAAAIGGVLVAAATLIAPWEGYYGRTYKDIVGVPTVCYGETDKGPVEEGRHRTFTKKECLDMLAGSLPKYAEGIKRCMKGDWPELVQVAGISLAYNVGVGAVCKSTFMRLGNAGDFKGACNALTKFNRAGGRVVKGLSNRRADERRVCLEGIR